MARCLSGRTLHARAKALQSAVSVSVQALERELDATLLTRTTRRVELTDAGPALLAEARRVLRAVDAARDAVAAVRGGVRGTLRLGIMQSPTLVDQGALVSRFHTRHPDVQVRPQLAPGGSTELANLVATGRFDVAFIGLPDGHPASLAVWPLAAEPLQRSIAIEAPDIATAAAVTAFLDLVHAHYPTAAPVA